MQKKNLFLMTTAIMVVLALALPAPVMAQDPDPTETPTVESEALVPESTEEPLSEALPSSNVAQYCTYTAGTNELIQCSMWYSSVSDTIDDALGSTLGYGVDLVFYLAALQINADFYADGGTMDGPIEVASVTVQGSSSGSTSTIINGYVQLQNFITGNITVRGTADNPTTVTEGLYFYYNSASITLENLVTTNDYWEDYSTIDIVDNGGDVTINNVDSSYGIVSGLNIEAVPMADSNPPTITISNSTFNGNDEDGITILTNGDVFMNNVTVEDNWQSGLDIDTSGNVTLNHITANNNGQGANITFSSYYPTDPCAGGCDEVPSTSSEVSSGSSLIQVMNSTFNNNNDYGLSINDHYASVELTNVTASGNGYGEGFSGPTSFMPYGSGIGVANPNSSFYVSMNGVTTNNNDGLGLYGFYAEIYGTNIQSNGNGGATARTYYGSSSPVNTANYFNSMVTEIECAQFDNNNSTGIYVSGFFVSMINYEAVGNTGAPSQINAWVAELEEGYENCIEQTEAPTYSDIVIEVMTDDGTGSGSINATQGLVFKLMEELTDGQKEMLARVAIPASAAPAGTTFTFTEVNEGDPASLPAGMTYVGRAFTITAVAADGSQLNNTAAYMELLFKVDPSLIVPDESHLAVVHYNEETGVWDELSTGFSNGYAYAYSALTGAYALVIVSD